MIKLYVVDQNRFSLCIPLENGWIEFLEFSNLTQKFASYLDGKDYASNFKFEATIDEEVRKSLLEKIFEYEFVE